MDKLKYQELRQAIIKNEFKHLNNKQLEAVLQTEGALLILAGAGSGKTTVLINRIVNILNFGVMSYSDYATDTDFNLLENYANTFDESIKNRALELCKTHPVNSWEILAITFTNKAAKELRERLEAAIGKTDIWAYTFHTACLRILRRDIEKVGHSKDFTIYDEDDRKKTIKEIVSSMNLDDKIYDNKKISGEISRLKDDLINASEFMESAGDYYKTNIANIYMAYEKKLLAANALDFDDIIFKTVNLLRNNGDIRAYYQNKFKYVLVDEYQDTNHAQYVLTSLLATNNICVVGDDDQSIYKFRGAQVTNILDFEKKYKNASVIRLEQNYRSTSAILDVANKIISNNKIRKSKKLWTDNKEGSKVYVYCGDNENEEANFIAKTILNNYDKKWSDFAILYRTNVLSNNLESAFKYNSIPYKIVSGRRFFDRLEIRDMFAYLWLIQNTNDNLRFKRIINVPARKIGDTSINNLELIAISENMSLFECASKALMFPELSRTAGAFINFTDMILELKELAQVLPLDEFYDKMLEKTNYLNALHKKGDTESQGRIDNILELKSNIIDFISRTQEPSLESFLEEMSLFTDMDKDDDTDYVTMMTMHASKGLEFKTVFLCGVEEGIFPSFRMGNNDDDLEEERRLCYVGVTRARENLFLTYAKRRMLYGQTKYARASKFIDEIPATLIDTNATSYQTYTKNNNSQTPAYQPNKPKEFEILYLATGDKVKHKIFGDGNVISIKDIGKSDSLLEIDFEAVGVKKLMRNSASQFMKKV